MPQAWKNGSWENEISRLVTRLSHRVDRLRALGNSVVPQQVYPLFKAIMESDKSWVEKIKNAQNVAENYSNLM